VLLLCSLCRLFFPFLNDTPLVGDYITTQQILAATLIALLTYINSRGVQFASLVQNIFTITKIGAIIILIIIGLYVGVQNDWIHFEGFLVSHSPLTQRIIQYIPLGVGN
jgi:APA family basic amino acid/polyamine antiporter